MAQAMTAGVVAEKMTPAQFLDYSAGIVEGLAYARYQADGRQAAGMTCVYNWFWSDTQKRLDQMLVAFAQFPDYSPAAVVSVMVRKECG